MLIIAAVGIFALGLESHKSECQLNSYFKYSRDWVDRKTFSRSFSQFHPYCSFLVGTSHHFHYKSLIWMKCMKIVKTIYFVASIIIIITQYVNISNFKRTFSNNFGKLFFFLHWTSVGVKMNFWIENYFSFYATHVS